MCFYCSVSALQPVVKKYIFVSPPLIYNLNDAGEMQMYFVDADISLKVLFIYCMM
jgi:hypothetical protein